MSGLLLRIANVPVQVRIALLFILLAIGLQGLVLFYWLRVLEPTLHAEAITYTRVYSESLGQLLANALQYPDPEARKIRLAHVMNKILLLTDPNSGFSFILGARMEVDPEVLQLDASDNIFQRGLLEGGIVIDVPLYHSENRELLGITRFYANDQFFHQLKSEARFQLVAGSLIGLVIVLLTWTAVALLVDKVRVSNETLRQMRDYSQGIIASMRDALLVMDIQGRIQSVNQATTTLLGLTEQELLEQSFHRLFGTTQVAGHPPLVLEDGFTPEHFVRKDIEGAFLHKEGWPIPVLFSLSELCAPTGDVRFVICVAKDITARQRMERELRLHRDRLDELVCHRTQELEQVNLALSLQRDALHRYASITSAAPTFLLLVGCQYEFLAVNAAFSNTFGRDAAQVEGHPMADIMDPVVLACMKPSLDDALAGHSAHLDVSLMTVDRGRRWIAFQFHPFRPDQKGADIAGVILIGEDITGRKRVEQAYEQSEARFQHIFFQNETPLLLLAPESLEILEANPAAETLLDVGAGALKGRTLPDFCNTPLPPQAQIFVPEAKGGHDILMLKSSGTSRLPVDCKWFTVRLEQGMFYFCALHDIREQWQMRQQIERLEDQLRQAQKMESIGTLAGGVAHDFNNILMNIFTHLEMLRLKSGRDNDGELLNRVQQMSGAAEQAKSLIGSLLTFSRNKTLQLELVNLSQILAGMEKLLLRLVGEDIELVFQYDAQPVTVLADGGQLEQVIMNLVANARDSMPEGGRLSLSAVRKTHAELEETVCNAISDPSPSFGVLICQDSGLGIAPEIQDRIFDPFFTTKAPGRGTGLGLSTSYGIMRRHHGGLEVRSLPGQGTVFVVFLPSATQCHVERVCDPEPQRVLDQTSATLLLAEDEEMVRAPLREFLILSGFQVIEAINGEEAVELFLAHQEKIDLLVFDMVMPKMSGYSAYRAIAQWRSDIPVLFLSGYSEHAMPIRELNNKGLEMVTKPIFPHELEARIRHMLDAHAAAPPSLTPPG